VVLTHSFETAWGIYRFQKTPIQKYRSHLLWRLPQSALEDWNAKGLIAFLKLMHLLL